MKKTATIAALNQGSERTSSNLTHRTLGGLIWMLSGAGVQSVLQILILGVLARLLTPTDFGLVGAALIVVSFSAMFYMLGLAPAIVQHSDLEVRHIRTGFTVSVLLGLFLAGLVWLLAPVISRFFRMPELTSVLRVLVLVFPLRSISVISMALLRRDLQFSRLAGIELVSYALGFGVVGIGLGFMGWGVWALAGAALGEAFLLSILSFVIQPHSIRPQFDRQAITDLMYIGGGVTAAKIFNYLALHGDNLVVGRWLGASTLGLYGRAYTLMAASATLFGNVLDKVLFPALAKVQDEPKRLASAYRRGVALIALISVPISGTLFLLAPEIVNVLLGPKWDEVVVPFQILAVGLVFRLGYKVTSPLAKATGAVYQLAWRQVAYAVLVIAGAWIGQHWGLSGAAAGVVVALCLHFLLMVWLSLQLTSITWGEFLSFHRPALSLAFIIWIEVGGVATLLRTIDWPPVLILVTSTVMIGLTLLALLRLRPELTFGKDGVQMLGALAEFIPEKFGFLQWLKKGLRRRLKAA